MPPFLAVYKALPPGPPAPDGTPPAAVPLTPVGTLADERGQLTFQYAEAALDLGAPAALSYTMPVRRKPYPDPDARAFFENLLPEGDERRLLTEASRQSDVAGLLGAVGGECAGAVSLWPLGTEPPPPAYRALVPDEAQELIDAQRAGAHAAPRLEGRQSMSGAQAKLVLYRRPAVDGEPPEAAPPAYALPLAGAPSTVLCKAARARFPGLLANELAAMRLMAAAGVPTAPSAVSRLHPAVYETARFDRWLDADGRVGRLHQEDGCQLTRATSAQKYGEGAGAPTYQRLTAALRGVSAAGGQDTERLFAWAVANLALGNRDAHAKNLGVLHTAAGPRLAPAYDVVCTLPYGLDESFPLPFGGARRLTQLSAHTLKVAAREFQLTPSVAAAQVERVTAAVLAGLDDALHAAATLAGHHPVLDDMRAAVGPVATTLRAALLGQTVGVGLGGGGAAPAAPRMDTAHRAPAPDTAPGAAPNAAPGAAPGAAPDAGDDASLGAGRPVRRVQASAPAPPPAPPPVAAPAAPRHAPRPAPGPSPGV